MSQQQFTELFQAEFAALLKGGCPKNEAAAKAIARVKEMMLSPSSASTDMAVSTLAAGKSTSTDSSSVESEAKKSKAEENLNPINVELVQRMMVDAEASGDYSSVIKMCGRVFRSSQLLNESFGLPPSSSPSPSLDKSPTESNIMDVDIEEPSSSSSYSSSSSSSSSSDTAGSTIAPLPGPIRVDIEGVAAAYKALLSSDNEDGGVFNSIMNAVEALCCNLQYSTPRMDSGGGKCQGQDPQELVQYLVILEHPELNDPRLMTLLKGILLAIDKLPEDSQRLISEWFGQSAGIVRFKRYVDTLQQYITLRMLESMVDDCKVATRVMNLLYVQYEMHYSGIDHVNDCKAARAAAAARTAAGTANITISYKDFNNEILNEEFLRTRSGRKTEYSLWQLDTQKGGLLLRQRELEEEKRLLAIHHAHQQKYLEAQQKQQKTLETQKQELKKLQLQLQQLERNSTGGNSDSDGVNGADGGEAREVATPSQIQELQGLQERLRTLNGHLNRQRESLQGTVGSMQQAALETAPASSVVTAGATSDVVDHVETAGTVADAAIAAEVTPATGGDSAVGTSAIAATLDAEVVETPAPDASSVPEQSTATLSTLSTITDITPAPTSASTAPTAGTDASTVGNVDERFPTSDSDSDSNFETETPVAVTVVPTQVPAPIPAPAPKPPMPIPPKRVEAPLPTAVVISDPKRRTLWEKLPYMKRESFLSYPWILSAAIKAEILEIEVQSEVQRGFEDDVADARRRGLTHIVPYLILQVRREHVVMDTLNRILALSMMAENNSSNSAAVAARMFKKPLKIIFDNEEGIDAGGVRKEYYQLLTKQLLDPAYGMFTYHEDSKLLWFNPHGFENDQEFELIGLMIGIAIYNGIILDLRMPMATYKKLRGRRVNLQDLCALQPTVGNSLVKLLEYDQEDFEDVFGLRFELTVTMFDCPVSIELKPGGADIPVTNENKFEYVDLYVQYVLEESVKTQFNAFARGFRKVCNNSGMDLFKYDELELLICGNPVLNMNELRAGARYEDGYTADSHVVHMFWTVVNEFDDQEKKQFLKFISGR